MKKIIPCLALFSMICFYTSGQNVRSVVARFKTINEGKNDKSSLEIVFKTADNVLIASYTDNPKTPSGGFKAFSTNELTLVPGSQPVDSKSLTGCKLAITFLPCDTCNETWKFDCDLYVELTDKSKKVFSFRQVTLTKKNYLFEKAVAN